MLLRWNCILLTLLFFVFSPKIFAQKCAPEALDYDKKAMVSGEYKGQALLSKLESLMRELKILSQTKYEGAQKNAMRYCLTEKDTLFQKLMLRPEPSIQENSAFQETIADFYKLHNDPRTALLHLDRALQINPKSLPLLIKNFQLFAEVENVQLKELSGKPIAIAESQRVLLELSRRAEKIATHPDASKELIVDALTHQAMVARIMKNNTLEMNYWDKILSIEPKNKLALQSRLSYYLSKGLTTEATESMKKLIREEMATEDNWLEFLELLFSAEKWEELISWSKKAPSSFYENRLDIQCQVARAYLELGRKNDAEVLMKKVSQSKTKLQDKAAQLAEQNKSRLEEIEADKLKIEGRLSEALDAYKNALAASPKPLSLKEKISLLIYEYRKGLNFQPAAATQADLKEVVNLLDKSVFETELKSKLFYIYLHSVKITNNAFQLKRACNRFKEIYPELLRSKDYLTYCQP